MITLHKWRHMNDFSADQALHVASMTIVDVTAHSPDSSFQRTHYSNVLQFIKPVIVCQTPGQLNANEMKSFKLKAVFSSFHLPPSLS